MRRLRALAAVALLAAATALTATVAAAPAQAAPVICDKFGSAPANGGRYIVQNNVWGASTPQCIDVGTAGFTVTQAGHNNATNGAPAAYPSIYLGCHYTNCSPGTNLPLQVSQIGSATSSITYAYAGGTFNASYDIWLDPTPRRDGQNAAEIMIWFNRQGSIQPIGSPVGTTTIGGRTWEVWSGNIGWSVISYVAPSPIASWNFSVLDFINDVRARGAITNSWYLTSIQAGFEPWVGGTGLGVSGFAATVSTGGGNPGPDTQVPTTPGTPTASNVTSSGATLNWAASSDNVGVTGYDVFRRQGTSGTFTQVATATGTSYAATGLAAGTQYQFNVVARDAAGNRSATSGTATVTTTTGGGNPNPGTGACRITYTPNSWGNGFTADVRVTNTGTAAVNGWTLTFTFPGNQQITSAWNATVTQSGTAVTARNVTHNAAIPANGSQSFGFQGTYSGTNGAPSGYTLNGAACSVA